MEPSGKINQHSSITSTILNFTLFGFKQKFAKLKHSTIKYNKSPLSFAYTLNRAKIGDVEWYRESYLDGGPIGGYDTDYHKNDKFDMISVINIFGYSYRFLSKIRIMLITAKKW